MKHTRFDKTGCTNVARENVLRKIYRDKNWLEKFY